MECVKWVGVARARISSWCCFGRSNHVFWVEVLEAISPWEVGCVVRDGAMSGNPQGIFELY